MLTMLGKLFKKRQGDDDFEAQVLPHITAMYGLALKLCRNDRDAEDLVQDALLRAFRFRHRYEPDSNIKAWLFKILTNTFYNSHRKRKNIRRLEQEAELGGHTDRFMSQASDRGRDAEAALLAEIATEQIKQAIEHLPEDFRVAVLLCDLYDFSYREISEILDCPVGTVMSRLYRGRRLMRELLFEYAVEQGYISAAGVDDSAEGSVPADLETYRRKRMTK